MPNMLENSSQLLKHNTPNIPVRRVAFSRSLSFSLSSKGNNENNGNLLRFTAQKHSIFGCI